MKKRFLALSVGTYLCGGIMANPVSDKLDLTKSKGKEILKMDQFEGDPDKQGVLKTYDVAFPKIEEMLFFGSDGNEKSGIVPANRGHMWVLDSNFELQNPPIIRKGGGLFNSTATSQGTFTVLKLADNRYMAILPLVGESSMAYFEYNKGESPVLKITTMGTARVKGEVPVLAYATADNIYEAAYSVWKEVVESDLKGVSAKMREQKSYPEYFNYLGWCSWEEYRSEINEENMTQAMKNIYASQMPIRWVLVDEGPQWYRGALKDRFKTGLYSLDPDPKKFPNGLAPLMKYKKEDGIKWMGIWHHEAGLYRGIDPENIMGEEMNKNFTTVANKSYRVKGDSISQYRFFEGLMGYTVKDGFDFVKVDFQGPQFLSYNGTENAVYAHTKTNRALEAFCENNNLALINCFANDMACALNSSHSIVTRASQDYRKGVVSAGRIQTYQCYNNKLWMGQTVFGDHDMFHSTDLGCNRLMAVSKAMSAAPVYLSDAPEHFVTDVITPLCYKDGALVRPLAPALPLPESFFNSPLTEKELYRVIAPLSNGAASIVCYNLYDNCDKNEQITVRGTVSKEDYKYASAMMQPYPGEWKMPKEGLVIYDYYSQKASLLTQKQEVEITGFADKLYHLCPIQKGWSMIGDVTKYLSPATVENLSFSSSGMSFEVKEAANVVFWMKKGVPTSQGLEFKSIGANLWSVAIPDALAGKKITINN